MHSTVRSKHPGLPWLFSSSLSGSKYPHLSGIEMAPGPWADGTGRLLNQLLQNIRLCNHSQSPIFVEMQGFKIYNIKRRSACSVTQSCPTFWNPMVSKPAPCQASLSRGLSRQEYWNGLPFPPPGDLPDPGVKPTSPVSPALQADSLPLSH